MKKAIRNILLVCTGVTMFAACSNVDYDGEHSSDGMFEPTNQVRFYYAQPGDTTVNYSFGVKPVDTLTHVVYLPVQLVGNLSAESQPFSVEVGKGTTAVAGKHYTLNADTLHFAPNAYRTYVPVTLIRANLSEDKDDSIRLVLNLVGKGTLGTRLTKSNTVKITFNNVLSKPDFWVVMESYWGLGPFTKTSIVSSFRIMIAMRQLSEISLKALMLRHKAISISMCKRLLPILQLIQMSYKDRVGDTTCVKVCPFISS